MAMQALENGRERPAGVVPAGGEIPDPTIRGRYLNRPLPT